MAALLFLIAQVPLLAQISETKLPDGILRYERLSPRPTFWQYVQDQWGWIVNARPFGKSIAFLVGVGNYQYVRPTLSYVKNDVAEMKQFLLDRAGFDVVYVALDNVANADLVDNFMLKSLKQELTPQDRLLFYFSGHGADLDAGEGYMQFGRARPGEYDRGQYIEMTRCEKWSKALRAKHVLFLLDACNSGLGYDSKNGGSVHIDEDLLALFSGDGSRTVITAGTGKEKSFQVSTGNDQGYSVFTRAFLDSIRNASPSGGGLIILDEVAAGIKRQVAEFSSKAPGRQMTPRVWPIPRESGRDRGTFVFLNPNAKKPTIPSSLNGFVSVTPKQVDVTTESTITQSAVAITLTLHSRVGEGAFQQKDYRGALREFLAAYKLLPDDLGTVARIGDCYFYLNELEEAERWITKAAIMDHNWAGPPYLLGHIWLRQGNQVKAKQSFDRSCALGFQSACEAAKQVIQ